MTKPASTLYDVLGLKPDASPAEIKAALRKKARQCHPDHHPGNIAKEEEFKAVSTAYKVLSDPKARGHYDTTGEAPSGDDTAAKAYGMIISNFKQLRDAEGDKIFYNDPVKLMENYFRMARKKILSEICKLRTQNKRLEKISKKLRHKGQKNSFLHAALADEQRQNSAMIQLGRSEVAATKKALELMVDFSFETEVFKSADQYLTFKIFTSPGGTATVR